jgi:RNA polymerase sigma-70 factor (ECF subfamily)
MRHQRPIVDAFLAASRNGDFGMLLRLLDPQVVLRADAVAVAASAASRAAGAPQLPAEVRGAAEVADVFRGRASAAQPALIDGTVGAVWAPGGTPRSVLAFTVEDGRIVAIEVFADPERISEFDLTILTD